MKTPVYLSKVLPLSKIVWVAKIMDNKILESDCDGVKIERFDDSVESNIGFYLDKLEYKICDKETFDKHFIRVVKQINQLSNI